MFTLLALVLLISLDTAEQSAQSSTSHDYTEVEEACKFKVCVCGGVRGPGVYSPSPSAVQHH